MQCGRELRYLRELSQDVKYIAKVTVTNSQQVQALERKLGVPLLQRKGRKCELTPAGNFFIKRLD